MDLESLLRSTHTLDLGCGLAKHEGALGVDSDPSVRPDIVHDLNVHPFPLPSNHFQVVICQDILEHVDSVEGFLREVHRVSKAGAVVHIRTPHFTSWYAYNDPTHRHVLGYFALDRFTDLPGERHSALFRYRKRRLLFPKLHRLTGVAKVANAYPARYEQLFGYMFPAENLEMELIVLED